MGPGTSENQQSTIVIAIYIRVFTQSNHKVGIEKIKENVDEN